GERGRYDGAVGVGGAGVSGFGAGAGCVSQGAAGCDYGGGGGKGGAVGDDGFGYVGEQAGGSAGVLGGQCSVWHGFRSADQWRADGDCVGYGVGGVWDAVCLSAGLECSGCADCVVDWMADE